MSGALKIIAAGFVGFLGGWYFFALTDAPTDHDFMVETTSYYFKTKSEMNVADQAKFSDCSLSKPDAEEETQGVSMFGICTSQSEGAAYSFFIAMGQRGRYMYSGFDEVGMASAAGR